MISKLHGVNCILRSAGKNDDRSTLVKCTANRPTAVMVFLTHVVDMYPLARTTSARYPLPTRNSHMNKYGAPDSTPFYNASTAHFCN